jgi:hypothetical protein
VYLEDAADNRAVIEQVVVVLFHSPDGREITKFKLVKRKM